MEDVLRSGILVHAEPIDNIVLRPLARERHGRRQILVHLPLVNVVGRHSEAICLRLRLGSRDG